MVHNSKFQSKSQDSIIQKSRFHSTKDQKACCTRYVASTILPNHTAQPLPEMPTPVVLGDKVQNILWRLTEAPNIHSTKRGKLIRQNDLQVQIGRRMYKPTHPQTQLGLLGLPLPLPPPLISLL